MKKFITIAFLLSGLQQLNAQSWSAKMAETVMNIWKDSLEMEKGKPVKWAYDQGVILKGIEGLWLRTGEKSTLTTFKKAWIFLLMTVVIYVLIHFQIITSIMFFVAETL